MLKFSKLLLTNFEQSAFFVNVFFFYIDRLKCPFKTSIYELFESFDTILVFLFNSSSISQVTAILIILEVFGPHLRD